MDQQKDDTIRQDKTRQEKLKFGDFKALVHFASWESAYRNNGEYIYIYIYFMLHTYKYIKISCGCTMLAVS